MNYAILRDGKEIPVKVSPRDGGYTVEMGGLSYEVDAATIVPGLYSLLVEGRSYEVNVYAPEPERYNVHMFDGTRSVELVDAIALLLRTQSGGGAGRGLSVRSPMPGKVVRLLVEPGQEVFKGQGIVVVEAMKMQNELQAPNDGVVQEVRVREGDSVEGGVDLVLLAEP